MGYQRRENGIPKKVTLAVVAVGVRADFFLPSKSSTSSYTFRYTVLYIQGRVSENSGLEEILLVFVFSGCLLVVCFGGLRL